MASLIRFEPSGANGLVASGTTIAAAAERLGVPLELACGGRGTCTSCAVRVTDEPFSISALTDAERAMLDESAVAGGIRLGCQARVGDRDCSVHVLEASERPPMPESSADQPGSSGDRPETAGAKGDRGGSDAWFGFDPWPWTGGRRAPCDETPDEESEASGASGGASRSEADELRRTILDAFAALPTPDQIATAVELTGRAASDFLTNLFDDTRRTSEEVFGALFREARNVAREAKARSGKKPDDPAAQAPQPPPAASAPDGAGDADSEGADPT